MAGYYVKLLIVEKYSVYWGNVAISFSEFQISCLNLLTAASACSYSLQDNLLRLFPQLNRQADLHVCLSFIYSLFHEQESILAAVFFFIS